MKNFIVVLVACLIGVVIGCSQSIPGESLAKEITTLPSTSKVYAYKIIGIGYGHYSSEMFAAVTVEGVLHSFVIYGSKVEGEVDNLVGSYIISKTPNPYDTPINELRIVKKIE